MPAQKVEVGSLQKAFFPIGDWFFATRHISVVHLFSSEKASRIVWISSSSVYLKNDVKMVGTTFLFFFTRYLRGNTDSKHRKQVIQGKGTFKKPYSQKPYAHMHVQQEGSRRFLCLNVQGEINAKTNEFSIAIYAIYEKTSFFHDKTALPKGYHYLKKFR